MDFSFVTPKLVLTLVHLLGLALGMGGALASDAMFFSSIRDKRIIKTEMRFLRLGSVMTWLGLLVMLGSGLGLFWLDPTLAGSAKFLAKMSVVLVIAINGLVFHLTHIHWIEGVQGMKLSKLRRYRTRRLWLLVSGAVSTVSWATALGLGVVRDWDWSYGLIIATYAVLVVGAVGVALGLRDKLLAIE